MKTPFELAKLQITRRKGRTVFLFLIMSVSIGVTSSILRLLQQSRSGIGKLNVIADAVVGPKESSLDLLWESLTLQKSHSQAIPFKLFQSLKVSQAPAFEDGTPTASLGSLTVVPAFLLQSNPVWFGTDFDFPRLGIAPVRGRWFLSDNEVVVGSMWAKDHSINVDSEIEGPGGHYKVTGILESNDSPWSETVYAPLTAMRSQASRFHVLPSTIWKEDILDFFLIKGVSEIQKRSLEHLVNERTVAQILWLNPEMEKLKEITGQNSRLFELMASLIAFLALVSLSGLLISEVQNLETQILTLRAIGYTKSELFGWMAIEGFLMAAGSILLGVVLDAMISPVMQESLSAQLPVFRFESLPIWSSAPLWLFILICVPLSLMYPMHRILNGSLSAALRK